MESTLSSNVLSHFQSPKKSVGDMTADIVSKLIAVASDIAIVLDASRKIIDVSTTIEALKRDGIGQWVGRLCSDTMAIESRPKLERLLQDAASDAPAIWREINHSLPGGGNALVSYRAVATGHKDRTILIGRDLGALSLLQQRLITTQQSMEREYARFRQAETRYRILVDLSSEAILFVDALTLKIVEANPAAAYLLGKSGKKTTGWIFSDAFDAQGAKAITSLVGAVRASGNAAEAYARLAEGHRQVLVSASLFRQQRSAQFLIRIRPTEHSAAIALSAEPSLPEAVERLPDGFVVADQHLQVLSANAAFLDMIQAVNDQQIRQQPLDNWIGRPGIDLTALNDILHEHGSVSNFPTITRGEFGANEDVEVSAVLVADGNKPYIAMSVRRVTRNPAQHIPDGRTLPQSVEQMTELVGRVPLKEMVREAADWIERLSIEAALVVTGDNKASAAEMLGLSRQSLYVKMRRFGLAEPDSDTPD